MQFPNTYMNPTPKMGKSRISIGMKLILQIVSYRIYKSVKNFQNSSWRMEHCTRVSGRATIDMVWEIKSGQMALGTQVYGRIIKQA